MRPQRRRPDVGEFAEGLKQNRDALLRGLTFVVGGLALLVVGNMVGLSDATWAHIVAGLVAVTGITVAFLGFFVYVLPPLLPAK